MTRTIAHSQVYLAKGCGLVLISFRFLLVFTQDIEYAYTNQLEIEMTELWGLCFSYWVLVSPQKQHVVCYE